MSLEGTKRPPPAASLGRMGRYSATRGVLVSNIIVAYSVNSSIGCSPRVNGGGRREWLSERPTETRGLLLGKGWQGLLGILRVVTASLSHFNGLLHQWYCDIRLSARSYGVVLQRRSRCYRDSIAKTFLGTVYAQTANEAKRQ